MYYAKCPECGKEILKATKQCPNCGYPIECPEETIFAQNSNQDNINKKTKRKSLIRCVVAIVAIIILVIGALFILRLTKQGQDKYEDFVITEEFANKIASINVEGRLVLDGFNDGIARVYSSNGNISKYGFIDKKGNVIVPLIYDYLSKSFSEGLAYALKDKQWGYVDKNGSVVIPMQFDGAELFSEGLAVVSIKGEKIGSSWSELSGYIDKHGNIVISTKYGIAYAFSEGLAKVMSTDWKWGFIDKHGNEVIPLQFEDESSFSEGMACVKKNGKYGYIDATGKEVIPFQFDEAGDFQDGLALVKKGEKKYHIDKKGNVAVKKKGKLTRVKRDGKYGFVNSKGKVIIPIEYDYANDFSEGLACVGKEKKYGYIDTKGNIVIPIEYSHAEDFCEGLAVVGNGNLYGYADRHGNNTFTDSFIRKQKEDILASKQREEELRRQEKQRKEEIINWLQGEWIGKFDPYKFNFNGAYVIHDTPNGHNEGSLWINLEDNTFSCGGEKFRFELQSGVIVGESNGVIYERRDFYGEHGSGSLMSKFNKLNEEGLKLVDEIGQYYYSGQAGPWVITDVYRLKQIADEKIDLARQMGDRDLESLCQQQKAQQLAALRQMGF